MFQVPLDEWGGGYLGGSPSDSGGEIPCRRMRSGSYIKAMGDDDSGDSDASPKASPKSALIAQREAFRRSVSMDQRSTSSKSVPTFVFVIFISAIFMNIITITIININTLGVTDTITTIIIITIMIIILSMSTL